MKKAQVFILSVIIGVVLVAAFWFLRLRPSPGQKTASETVAASGSNPPTATAALAETSEPTASLAPTERNAKPMPAAEKEYNIVTLLPRDAIPAIDSPRFYSAAEADAEYDPDELVLGVSINGESKAYSTFLLDGHEIVNDSVGGRKIAVTW